MFQQIWTTIKHKSELWSRKFTEAWLSCATMMVQGDFTVFSVKHALTAAEVGATAGVGVVITSFFAKLDNKFALAWTTGVVVMLADLVTHPTHFGEHYTEALVTGMGAMMLSVIFSYLKR